MLHSYEIYEKETAKHVPQVIVVDTMVSRTEGQVVGGRGVELHTAHVRLRLVKHKIQHYQPRH